MRAAVILLLSAVASYLALDLALRWRSSPGATAPVFRIAFAAGGAVSPSDIRDADATLRRLAAAHCTGDGPPAAVSPEELTGAVDWPRGTPAAVLCPESEIVRGDTLTGFSVTCEAGRAALYARLARTPLQDATGCLVIIGASSAAVLEPSEAGLPPDANRRAVFRTGGGLYAWVERADRVTGQPVDEVTPISEP
jgi:hypothetical protein